MFTEPYNRFGHFLMQLHQSMASKSSLVLLLDLQAALDYAGLELQPFYAGAAVRLGPQFHRVADPLR